MTDAAFSDAPHPHDTHEPAVDELSAESVAVIDPAPLVGIAPVKPDSPLFSSFAIKPEIIAALQAVGIEHTFAIQELTLPIALAGSDLIGQARTGTGKTLGFGVPMLNRLELPSAKGAKPQALVIAPTRELAVQVAGDLTTAGKRLGAKVVTIYGGRAYEPQVEALKSGCDVVVGTPGRLLDLSQQGHLNLGFVRCLVLDEADEMLDLGFLPDIEKLMSQLPAGRQTMLFSATMPGPIVALARQFLNQPIQIRAESDSHIPATEHVDQFAYRAHAMDKTEVLARILQAEGRGLTLIFTRTKRTAQKVADDLVERGFAAGAVHGDLSQGAREQALRAFRSGKVDVLVATDVAARGLDIDDVTHVINYQCPEDAMTYVHRIGRTARAGKSGTSVTLVDWDDLAKWKLICDTLNLPLHEPVETYSTSDHLFLELSIPTSVKGVLPRAARTRAGLGAEAVEDLGGSDRKKSGRGDRDHGPAGRSSRSGRPEGSARAEGSGRSRSRAEAPASGSETEPSERKPAASRNRRRRRTRAGAPVTGASSAEQSSAG
ncbi:MAG TPA: DEAD/DEAH box helicase [Jatrophihabitans sp.]|jgi:superfamily II DNA/RNA helicase|uniref:DEAD/DEAH box helicase n=1 Tax=Jatrophihabitans sp. TaxID=1932789 RepID=UPI002EDC9E65